MAADNPGWLSEFSSVELNSWPEVRGVSLNFTIGSREQPDYLRADQKTTCFHN